MLAWAWGLATVGASVLLAVAGLLLVRRFTKLEFLERHNEVAGFIYAVIGVIYAVLLAFVVAFVWEQFHAAETRVELEANSLGDLYRDSQAFPEAISSELHRQIRSYAQIVLEAEWPALASGGVSAEAWQAFNELWETFIQLEPQNAYEAAWYSEIISDLNDLGDNRRLRLLSSHATVPGILWAVLLVGGIITVSFSYFFGTRNTWPQVLMIAALAAMVSLSLFLIMALDHPLQGPIHVKPSAFEQVIEIFDHWAKLP